MSFVIEGILTGLALSLLVGPILIVLIQTSLENSSLAGFSVGFGIWTSDLIIIAAFYIFFKEMKDFFIIPENVFWFGIGSGIVLIGFGIYMFYKKMKLNFAKQKMRKRDFLSNYTKGFLVNTINPFTFLFWMGFISTAIFSRNLDSQSGLVILISIMATIVSTDSFKILLARKIKQSLNSSVLNRLNKISGIIIGICGIVMIIRTII